MIAIITPVYKAWDMVEKMCQQINHNTASRFVHILVTDSCEMPEKTIKAISGPDRALLGYDDGLAPELHRPNITKATQVGYDFLKSEGIEFDYLFYVETDVMVPRGWDAKLIQLSASLPEDWITLDVYPVDEDDVVTYPANNSNPVRAPYYKDEHQFEIVLHGDWNAMLFNPKVAADLNKTWRFDDVPSHHDILLSRNFREKLGLEREEWTPPLFYRTPEIRAVHYANASRRELPEGMKTPSNPA